MEVAPLFNATQTKVFQMCAIAFIIPSVTQGEKEVVSLVCDNSGSPHHTTT